MVNPVTIIIALLMVAVSVISVLGGRVWESRISPPSPYIIGGFPECGDDIPTVPPKYAKAYLEAADVTDHSPTACQLARQGYFESHWQSSVVSPAGAVGIAQFLPATARDYGIDPTDLFQSISAQAKYMAHLMSVWHHHDRSPAEMYRLALASYNDGIGNMLKSQRRHGWITWEEARPHLPQETRDYVMRIAK